MKSFEIVDRVHTHTHTHMQFRKYKNKQGWKKF